MLVFFN